MIPHNTHVRGHEDLVSHAKLIERVKRSLGVTRAIRGENQNSKCEGHNIDLLMHRRGKVLFLE